MTFADIPEAVIDYVRRVFALANDRVTRKMSDHPSMHEETLDHALIDELILPCQRHAMLKQALDCEVELRSKAGVNPEPWRYSMLQATGG